MAMPMDHPVFTAELAFPRPGHRVENSSAVLDPPRIPASRSSRSPVQGLRTVGLRISVTYPRRGVVLVTLAGELDLNTADRVRDLLAPRFDSALSTVVLDLSQLNFLSVAGLGLLRAAHNRAVTVGIDLRVVAVTREVTRPLRMTELDRLLTCYRTVAEALDRAGTE